MYSFISFQRKKEEKSLFDHLISVDQQNIVDDESFYYLTG